MLSRSFCAPLALLVGYAVAVSVVPAVPAAPGLTVKTSTSNISIDGVQNLKVTATVVNTGGETLKLLNDPRGVLDPFPEDTFNITNPSGSNPSFNGVTVNHNPTDAVGLADSTSLTVLAPGESINVTHDLSAAYNFTQPGAGEYSIKPSNLFTYIDAGGNPKDLYAVVEGAAKVKLSGNLRTTVSQRTHDKRAKFHGCSLYKRESIIQAAEHAQAMATESYKYVKDMSYFATLRYRKWFGPYSQSRRMHVEDTLRKLSHNDQFARATYVCECDDDPNAPDDGGETRAYTEKRYPGVLWLCKPFWNYRRRTRGGIIFHEFLHFAVNGALKDHFYNEIWCEGNATIKPWDAVDNADSYMFFAHNRKQLP